MVIEMSGSEFRKIRKRLRLKQEALGELLGRTRHAISKIETQETVPNIYVLAIKQLEANTSDVAA